jgi:hypothetical protein
MPNIRNQLDRTKSSHNMYIMLETDTHEKDNTEKVDPHEIPPSTTKVNKKAPSTKIDEISIVVVS